jgi:hypothetical protein
MALDNDNPKMSKETDERTDNRKIKVSKDEDMEDDSPCISQLERDINFRDYIEAFVFDDKLEKEEMTKMEQDFIDSDPEEEVWVSTPSTSLDEEDMSHDEEKAPVLGPFTQVPKFVGTFITF